MRQLKIIEHISLDGVIQTTGGPDNDFPYGDWTAPYRSPAGLQIVTAMYGENCDVLFGRRTYDLLGNFWPKAPKSPMADRLNAATKYVVTHRPESLEWGPSKAVGPDLIEGVRRIKATDGADLILTGSTTLTSALLEHGLADEIVLLVNPVLLGNGKRLFAEGTPARAFTLESTQALPSGITVSVYALAEPEVRSIAHHLTELMFPETNGVRQACEAGGTASAPPNLRNKATTRSEPSGA